MPTTPRTTQYLLRIPVEILTIMRGIKERDGIPVAEQVRRALALWIAVGTGGPRGPSSTP